MSIKRSFLDNLGSGREGNVYKKCFLDILRSGREGNVYKMVFLRHFEEQEIKK